MSGRPRNVGGTWSDRYVPDRPSYRLVAPALAPPAAPSLDEAQQAVVEHADGPLLVLAGPGTGKTTTLVEAVVARVAEGASPDEVLVLTFSRKAADELRERIATRVGRTVVEPAAHTFHGFCHAVVRGYGLAAGAQPPRLLSGAEREVRIRELLRGNAADEGLTRWPIELRPALTLRGFAREVADLLDRARERGLDATDLVRLGQAHGRPEWVAAGQFLDEYLAVLEARGELDYAGLVAEATALLDGAAAELCSRFSAVYVDEYQDTDPSQERLLRRLAGDGRLLVAVGDPDQSIYGFRGAEVTNILDFPNRFRGRDGAPAPVLTLTTCRRMGQPLLQVSRELARRIPLGSLTRERDRHRGLAAAGPPAASTPEIRLLPTVADEVIAIADLLRRAHLVDGVRWDQMAVLVRSGVRSIPVLRRALVAAGVPVSVASDEVPLARDPAVAPLLGALEVAASRNWAALTSDLARVLLLSPLGGATPSVLRALGRRLRALQRASGAPPTPSAVLIRDAIVDGRDLVTLDDWAAAPARRLSRLLGEAQRLVAERATPEEVLWSLWDGSGWGRRLAGAATGAGAPGRAADRDLDAIVGLFEAATRLEDRRPRAGVSALLEEIAAQEIPAAALEERPAASGAVRLLTGHRSKGLEWDLVVVAGVQDGVWPDLRRRGSLLDADSVDQAGPRPVPSTAMLLAEERRLFYVALTRARRRLVVTAVSGVDDESERPSRFLDELGLSTPSVGLGSGGLLGSGSLVARLRRALVDEATTPARREQAALELARLAAAVDGDGESLVPAAHPDRWWGVGIPTEGAQPVRSPDTRVALSGSTVSSFGMCPRRWFLDHEVHAQGVSTSSQGFGSVVHALAEAVATEAVPAEGDALMQQLDSVWDSLPFDAQWQRDREHENARALLERFLRWHRDNDRELLGAEIAFTVDYGDDVVLRGRADRLERDADGGVVVVDLKTSKNPPKDKDLPTEPQLGVYQLAVREGAFAVEHPGPPGGAELVQLRQTNRGKVKVQPQPALDPTPGWADELVTGVARDIRAESFVARPNDLCDRCAYRTSCPAVDAGDQVVP